MPCEGELCLLEVVEVMHCVLLCMLEDVEVELCLVEVPEVMCRKALDKHPWPYVTCLGTDDELPFVCR